MVCAVCAKLLHSVQLCVTLWTVAHQAPLSVGILQARILQHVAMPSSRETSQPSNRTWVSCIAGGFFTIWATRETQINYTSFKKFFKYIDLYIIINHYYEHCLIVNVPQIIQYLFVSKNLT